MLAAVKWHAEPKPLPTKPKEAWQQRWWFLRDQCGNFGAVSAAVTWQAGPKPPLVHGVGSAGPWPSWTRLRPVSRSFLGVTEFQWKTPLPGSSGWCNNGASSNGSGRCRQCQWSKGYMFNEIRAMSAAASWPVGPKPLFNPWRRHEACDRRGLDYAQRDWQCISNRTLSQFLLLKVVLYNA